MDDLELEENNTENIVDLSTIGNIHRKALIEENFSADINKREEEKQAVMDLLNEPIRRLEFDVLLSMCEPEYEPYSRIKQLSEQYKEFGVDWERLYTTVPRSEIEMVLPDEDLDKPINNLTTLEYAYNRSRVIFRHREEFKKFSDSAYLSRNSLYRKLFSVTVKNSVKVLYYFLSKYRYDFLDTLSNYDKTYHTIKQMDDLFCERGYHKRVIPVNM